MVSKVPLPDYRADLDERHGSTQKEVNCFCLGFFNFATVVVLDVFKQYCYILSILQIRMSTETETRIGNLLNSSQSQGASTNNASEASGQGGKQRLADRNVTKLGTTLETDSNKEKLSLELKEKQETMKVQFQYGGLTLFVII